jgi:hypothetical protein
MLDITIKYLYQNMYVAKLTKAVTHPTRTLPLDETRGSSRF